MVTKTKSTSIARAAKLALIVEHIRLLTARGNFIRSFRLLPWLIVIFVVPSTLASSLGKDNTALDAELSANPSAVYGNLPLAFEENLGQFGDKVKFLSRGRGYSLFLMPNETALTVWGNKSAETVPDEVRVKPDDNALVTANKQSARYKSTMRMRLLQAHRSPRVFGEEPLAGKVNYFIGKDPENWQTDVPLYRKVRYDAVYPGIDLIYYGNHQRQLEYDFVISPKADPESIQFVFDGPTNMSLTESGDLTLRTVDGEFVHQKPIAYQERDGKREQIDVHYVLSDNNVVSFQLGDYDKRETLVIDPVLNSTTYIGGRSDDAGLGIAVDVKGNIYITGSTESSDFPTRTPYKQSLGGEADAYVLKLNSAGDGLVYATYFGGDGRDSGFGIAVDSTGHAHVTGETTSTDLPTTVLSFQEFLAGDVDGFVVKLQPQGNALEYVTYLGGNSTDKGNAIALDESEDAYVTGETDSSDFPTKNAVQDSLGGMSDAFIVKLWRDGDGVDYSTYLGGKRTDRGNDIAVDATGKAHVAGTTFSDNFPTTRNAFQTSPPLKGSTVIAAFVAKLNDAGNSLEYSTYLGDTLTDRGNGIAVDAIGNIYVTGLTQNDEILRCKNCLEGFNIYMGGLDAFIAKFNPAGTNENDLIYYNYLGSLFDDVGESIAVDVAGNAYVAGFTEGAFTVDGRFPFPFQAKLIEPEALGDDFVRNAFVVKINPEGNKFVYATIFGGENDDTAKDIAVDIAGNAYVAGITASPNFPVWNFYQDSLGGGSSAFVAKISDTQIHSPVLPSTTSEHSLLGVNGVLDDLCKLENLMRIPDNDDQYWENQGNATATARARYSADPSETFEYIDLNNTRQTVFFERGVGTDVSSSGTLPSIQELPTFRWGLEGVFSSKPSDNADGADNMVTWEIIGAPCSVGNYLIAWEDRDISASDSDQNYQDLVVEVSGVVPLAQVNDLVILPQDGVDTQYLSDDPRAPAGVFAITATFTNDSSTAIKNPFFGVVAITGGNTLLNADGGPGAVGATLTPNVGSDRVLSPGETTTVTFEIGLQCPTRFSLLVDLFEGSSLPPTDTVSDADPIRIFRPLQGDTWFAGGTESIVWDGDEDVLSSVVIEYSTNRGMTWDLVTVDRSISPSDPEWENFRWMVPEQLAGAELSIRIADYPYGEFPARSDLIAVKANPLQLLRPTAGDDLRARETGDEFIAGGIEAIRWDGNEDILRDGVSLEYSADNGQSWEPISVPITPQDRLWENFDWRVPVSLFHKTIRVRVSGLNPCNQQRYEATSGNIAVVSIDLRDVSRERLTKMQDHDEQDLPDEVLTNAEYEWTAVTDPPNVYPPNLKAKITHVGHESIIFHHNGKRACESTVTISESQPLGGGGEVTYRIREFDTQPRPISQSQAERFCNKKFASSGLARFSRKAEEVPDSVSLDIWVDLNGDGYLNKNEPALTQKYSAKKGFPLDSSSSTPIYGPLPSTDPPNEMVLQVITKVDVFGDYVAEKGSYVTLAVRNVSHLQNPVYTFYVEYWDGSVDILYVGTNSRGVKRLMDEQGTFKFGVTATADNCKGECPVPEPVTVQVKSALGPGECVNSGDLERDAGGFVDSGVLRRTATEEPCVVKIGWEIDQEDRTSISAFLARQRASNTVLIEKDRPTWVVIHGRQSHSEQDNIVALASAIGKYSAGDQVLVLDWKAGAGETTLVPPVVGELQGARWIPGVAKGAAEALIHIINAAPQNLYLVGHSWGTYVAYEIAAQIGGVAGIIAIDPARTGAVYYDNSQIDFRSYSDFSWAFYGAGGNYGSEDLALTAHETFRIRILGLDLARHTAPVWAVTDLVNRTNGGNPDPNVIWFDLDNFTSKVPGPWQTFDETYEAEIDAIGEGSDWKVDEVRFVRQN